MLLHGRLKKRFFPSACSFHSLSEYCNLATPLWHMTQCLTCKLQPVPSWYCTQNKAINMQSSQLPRCLHPPMAMCRSKQWQGMLQYESCSRNMSGADYVVHNVVGNHSCLGKRNGSSNLLLQLCVCALNVKHQQGYLRSRPESLTLLCLMIWQFGEACLWQLALYSQTSHCC